MFTFTAAKKSLRNQKGFSLVELMVVVAIIGILAAIAVPSLNKYMAKSRQSEAKLSLASIYTAEKAFFAEYNVYDSRLRAIGFVPEGKIRYNVGFSAAGTVANATNGYAPTTAPAADFDALTICGDSGVMENGCTTINGVDNAEPPVIKAAVTATPVTGPIFTAGTAANLTAVATDRWTIDNQKVVTNTSDGIN